ncbi:MAG: PAS domain S-box protein [Phycisphaeraceae bacterium]|nr:PAS domain S-box protein [Phycisphaeraceae bacterium]
MAEQRQGGTSIVWAARRIALTYLAVAGLWILLSDAGLERLGFTGADSVLFQTVKGLFFVTVTALLLYLHVGAVLRRQSELNRTVAESRARFYSIFERSPVALLVVQDGRIEMLNAYAQILLGPAARWHGRDIADVFDDQDRATAMKIILGDGTPSGTPAELVHAKNAQGEGIELELSASEQWPDIGGRLIALVDVTEQRNLERALVKTQRMEAMGVVAAGIAHDFNNLLTAMMGYVQLAAVHANGNRAAKDLLDSAMQAGMQAGNLVRSLLTFGRAAPMQKKLMPLKEVIDGACMLIRGAMPSRVHFTFNFEAPEETLVHADAAQVRQALLNLAINARDAMPNGGDLAVVVSLSPDARGVPMASITVADTGSGISAASMQTLFEPFFTTKGDVGVGLGLPVSRGIIQDHGGDLTAVSELGKGAVFTITIPIAAGPESKVEPKAASAGVLTVLVAHDKAASRELLCSLLRKSGCEPIPVASGVECVETHMRRRSNFAGAIIGIQHESESGLYCLARIRAANDNTPVVLISDILAQEGGVSDVHTTVVTESTPEQQIVESMLTTISSHRAARQRKEQRPDY